MLLCVLALIACVRRDGWDGNMRPIFAWRWTPTPEEQSVVQIDQTELTPIDLVPAPARDYPGFLGADRRGVVRDLKLARDWSAQPPREWRS